MSLLKQFSNISPSVYQKHLLRYSPTLVDYPDKYFTILKGDWDIVSPYQIFICPLCVQEYIISLPSGFWASAEFSQDHLPPESVGGRFKVLTCKKCNNDWGPKEASLSQTLNLGSIPNKKNHSIFSNAKVGNKDTGEFYNVYVRRTNGKIDIQFNESAKKHNPNLQAFIKKMHDGGLPITLLVETPNHDKIGMALLKSAYLLGFVWWGYSFVYSTHGQSIREVLQGTRAYPIRLPAFFVSPTKSPMQRGVSIFKLHGKKEAFLNVIELKTDHDHVMAGVLIPNPTASGWEALTAMNEIIVGKTPTAVEATTIPTTRVPDGYSLSWNLIP